MGYIEKDVGGTTLSAINGCRLLVSSTVKTLDNKNTPTAVYPEKKVRRVMYKFHLVKINDNNFFPFLINVVSYI